MHYGELWTYELLNFVEVLWKIVEERLCIMEDFSHLNIALSFTFHSSMFH